MSDSLTAEQASAASFGGSVAVVAGAGTGKTKLLAHRYLHHLDEGLSPLAIVAVTFTERAAAELRSRIRSLVREERPANRRALVELEAAQISTVHALAARICREHPLEAEVAPDFAILDDLDGVIWRAERLDEAIVALPPAILAEFDIDTLTFVLGALLNDPLNAAAALAKGPDRWRELLDEQRSRARDAVVQAAAWSESRSTLLAYSGAAGDKGELARQACLRAIEAFEAGEAAAALEAVKSFRAGSGAKGNWPGGGLDEVKAASKAIKELITEACEKDGRALLEWEAVDDELARLVPLLAEAFEHVSRHLEAARRDERKLDFTALEVHALRALAHPEVVAYYASRWRAILVDEFQDTNPIQARILELLSRAATITVVGDEKQAIYGFRGADAEVFRSYRATVLAGGGREVVLSSTFRSHPQLVSDFEGIFAELLGELHQSMSSARTPAPGAAPFTSYHPVTLPETRNDRGRSNRAAKRLSEAHAIGLLIADLVAAKTPIVDPQSGATRPVRFGDIAILARGKAPFETYSQVLPALGVPAVDTGGGNLLDIREAKDGLAVLRFLADPHDDVALAAILRGPFFALDDRALLRLAESRATEDDSWWPALQTLQTTTDEAFERAHRVLAGLLETRWTQPPSRVVQVLDQETGYSAIVANLPGGARRLADWRGFLALLRTLEAEQGDAFAVNRRLRRLLQAEVEVARPTMQAGDAVALMTIHKSKGLEWPVVIVADLSYVGGGAGRELYVDPDYGVAFKLNDEDGEAQEPVLHRLLKLKAKEREEEELRRLYYVAFTRARDRLILTTPEADRGPLKLLEPALAAAGVAVVTVEHDSELSVPDAPLPDVSELGLTLGTAP